MFLFDETFALNELQFNIEEQRHLKELLLKSSEFNIPLIVSLADYFTNTILVVSVSSSLALLIDWYSKKPFTSKRVNIVLIWQVKTSFTSFPSSTSLTNSNN
jgi:hypothetical protein